MKNTGFGKIKNVVNRENAQKVGAALVTGVKKVIPHKDDAPEKWFFKTLLLSLLAVMVLSGAGGIAGFLLTLKEPEEVIIPQVVGKELADAIEELQLVGLVPYVQRRFSTSPETRGRILEQTPKENTTLKVGRKVTITLSLGAAMDKVGDYTGKNLEEVREDLRTAFGSDNPLISLGQITYTYDDSEPGTILSQEPSEGTQLSRSVQLSLLVSRGRDESLPTVGSFVGLSYLQAMEELGMSTLPFVWTLTEGHSDNQSASVVTQDPVAGASLPKGNSVRLTLSPPLKVPDDVVFDIYKKTLPDYAVPVDILVQVRQEAGAPEVLYRFKSMGGQLSFPYQVPKGSVLLILAFNREIDRVTIPKGGE